MGGAIYLSLPVSDVARSAAFYEAIGFTPNPAMSNERAASLRWSDAVTLNVLDHALYASLTPKRIIDAHCTSGALIALALPSRAAVDTMVAAALAAGGREAHGAEEEGPLYCRGFEDPDGHGFGPFHMAAFDGMRGQEAAPAAA